MNNIMLDLNASVIELNLIFATIDKKILWKKKPYNNAYYFHAFNKKLYLNTADLRNKQDMQA